MDSLTLPLPANRPNLHVVREEDPPAYDAAPRRESRHVTIIEDDVVEAVAETCGLTGLGLYCYLERRVNRDANWQSSMVELAAAFQCSVRHIRDTCKALEDAGFIVRTPINGRTGMTVGIRFNLPKHMRTYRAEPNPELGAELTPEPTPELSCARDVVTSNSSSESNSVVTPLSPNGGTPKKNRSAQKTPYPDDFTVTTEMMQWACFKYSLTSRQVTDKTEKFERWAKANDRRYANWEMAWRNFMEPKSWDTAENRQSDMNAGGRGKWVQ